MNYIMCSIALMVFPVSILVPILRWEFEQWRSRKAARDE